MDAPAPARPQPALTPRAEADRLARVEREAAALRANLTRRKAQSRARATPPDAPAPPGPSE